MSLIHIGLILLFLIIFSAGLLVIIKSKNINDWIFRWSIRFLNNFGDVSKVEGQRGASLGIIRVFSFLIMVVCVLFLYYLFSDIHW